MLYPLSYEGGDGAERGAKLGATARKPWGKGSSGSIGRSKVQLDQTEVSNGVWALVGHRHLEMVVHRFGVFAQSEQSIE